MTNHSSSGEHASVDGASADDSLRFEVVNEHIGIITLNRPSARNALTFGMYAALEHAVRTAPSLGVRCLVVTGADPAFCSGDDVRQVMGGGQQGNAPAVATPARAPRLTPAADALLHCLLGNIRFFHHGNNLRPVLVRFFHLNWDSRRVHSAG